MSFKNKRAAAGIQAHACCTIEIARPRDWANNELAGNRQNNFYL